MHVYKFSLIHACQIVKIYFIYNLFMKHTLQTNYASSILSKAVYDREINVNLPCCFFFIKAKIFFFLVKNQFLLNMPLLAQYSLHVAAPDFSLCAWLRWIPIPDEREWDWAIVSIIFANIFFFYFCTFRLFSISFTGYFREFSNAI